MTGGGKTGTSHSAPVVVLTYAHAGVVRLRNLLSEHPDVACTTGTGLLPLCEQAAATWRNAEGRRTQELSRLATTSVRGLADAMITIILARSGRWRWCETAVAQQGAAETFQQLYPDTQFLCLHRSCPDMIYAALQANPWGLSGPAFSRHVAAHPDSAVAALAAYWAAHAGPLLAFERAHPDACLRVRYEDLVQAPGQTTGDIVKFLGLRNQAPNLPPLPDDDDAEEPALSGADAPGCGADVPAGQFPKPLLAQVNELHAMLDYPPLPAP